MANDEEYTEAVFIMWLPVTGITFSLRQSSTRKSKQRHEVQFDGTKRHNVTEYYASMQCGIISHAELHRVFAWQPRQHIANRCCWRSLNQCNCCTRRQREDRLHKHGTLRHAWISHGLPCRRHSAERNGKILHIAGADYSSITLQCNLLDENA